MENKSKQDLTVQRDSATQSIWQRNAIMPDLQQTKGFNRDQVYDCLIVGAGITGITTALLLQQAGLNCVIAEARSAGFGTTSGTSAHLNTFFDATYPEIESDFGHDAAKLTAQAGKEAFDIICSFVKDLKIDCDLEFKQAWLYAENEKENKELIQILEASKRAGLQVEIATESDVPVPFSTVIKFEQQGQFHPLKYINGLLAEYIALGGILLENTPIISYEPEGDSHIAKAGSVAIKANKIVYATHMPPGINLLDLSNAPYRSYVIGLRLKDDQYPAGLAYDMQEPYHYFRTHIIDGQKYLLVGGEDHKTGHGDPDKAFENLKTYVSQYYKVESVDFEWSAQYYVPADGLPYIGQLPGHDQDIFVATGFNGNGMMFGTLSGRIIADLILGKKNKYQQLFDPSRLKPLAGFKAFVKENADVAWHFLADRFSFERLDELQKLKAGEGKLVKFEDKQLAVYKDAAGKITALNPTCTHAGCIVQFNHAEQSWDCPCHGGRFDISGKVLNGPPTQDLEKIIINYDLQV